MGPAVDASWCAVAVIAGSAHSARKHTHTCTHTLSTLQVVIFSRTDGIDRHRWPRVAPLFVPLNTALAPPQLCLFILLASTITEEGGFPNWLQGLLQEWEHESN